jgi:hypothetical protein
VGAVKNKFHFDIVSFEIALPAEFKEVDLQEHIAREQVVAEVKKEALDSHKQEYKRQLDVHMSKIQDFVGEVTNTLRSKVIEHCTVALNKINKRELVSDANVKTLLKHIQDFREMNFVDDRAIEAELSKVEKMLDGDHNFAKDKDALGLLRQHLTSVVDQAKNLTDVANVSGEYFRKLEV